MYKLISTLSLLICLAGGDLLAQGKIVNAKNYEAYLSLYKNKSVNIVRSHADFKKYVANHEILKKYFNKELMNSFLEDLVFCEKGLVAFKYNGLVNKYPTKEKEIFNYLAQSFGWDPGPLGVDYEGYYCAAPDCKKSDRSICIGDNCGSASHFTTGRDFLQK